MENKIKNIENAKEIEIKSSINFKNISFKYNPIEENVLDNINLEFEGGQSSVVGHSGSGKSTILNLIPRFYQPHSGDLTIDGQSIYELSLSSLRKNISLVSQETTLFDDSIINNIKYANENAEHSEIVEVAKLSNCHDFIEKLPNKYETIIGENGVRLSGGKNKEFLSQEQCSKKAPSFY